VVPGFGIETAKDLLEKLEQDIADETEECLQGRGAVRDRRRNFSKE
jgi:hypothetical protein